MDTSAAQAMIGSLRTATDISKALLDPTSHSDIHGRVIELQKALLAALDNAMEATNAQFTLQVRIRELEAQIEGYEDWAKQKVRYTLANPWSGPAQVYALRRSHSEGEVAHYLCTHCFQNKKRVILNPLSANSWMSMTCPACKATTPTSLRSLGKPRYAEDIINPASPPPPNL